MWPSHSLSPIDPKAMAEASQLIAQGYLARPDVIFHDVAPVQTGLLAYKPSYRAAIVQNAKRNTQIADIAARYARKGKTILIAVDQVGHGKLLLAALHAAGVTKSIFIRGENESEEKIRALRDLDSRQVSCVVATTVFGEGVDVPSLDVLINAKGNKSRVVTLQIAGRALRKTATKSRAAVIDFIDHARYFRSASKTRWLTYRTESEFRLWRSDPSGSLSRITKWE